MPRRATHSHVYGLSLISMTDSGASQKYLSYDGLGSVTDITNGSGTVTDTFVYDVFGAVKTRTGTSVDAWKFTGEQADDGSGDRRGARGSRGRIIRATHAAAILRSLAPLDTPVH